MKTVFWLICLTIFSAGCASTDVTPDSIQATAAALDYGDSSSQTLLNKAWRASKKKNYPELLAYTQRCIDLYGDEGRSMNAELTDFEPEPTAAQKWALNDVGTCLFIMAHAYEDMDMYAEATQAYRTLAEDYTFAQSWDPKGWFWRPADGAARKAEKMKNW